jgi:hypothetical protein
MNEADKRHKLEDEVFTYLATKDGKVFLYWHGKQVKTLAGAEATRFTSSVSGLDHKPAQLLMARITGNFKRGNERQKG